MVFVLSLYLALTINLFSGAMDCIFLLNSLYLSYWSWTFLRIETVSSWLFRPVSAHSHGDSYYLKIMGTKVDSCIRHDFLMYAHN